MLTLRLSYMSEGNDYSRFKVTFGDVGKLYQTATTRLNFVLMKQDRRNWRWYLEDYLQNTQLPTPTVAARFEQRMSAIGQELFTKVFDSSDKARALWEQATANLLDIHVEIVTDVAGDTAIPWELLPEPQSDTSQALQARQVYLPEGLGRTPFALEDFADLVNESLMPQELRANGSKYYAKIIKGER